MHQEVALALFLEEAGDTGRHRLETEGPGVEQRSDSSKEHTEPYPPASGFLRA